MEEQEKHDGEGTQPLDAFRRLWKPSDAGFIEEITAPQRSVLAVLVVHTNEDGVAWPSHATIAKASGLGRSTVVRVLGQLEALGAVIRTSSPPQPTHYTVPLWDSPALGPSRSERETVPQRACDRPAAGHELLIELPNELDTSKSKDAITDMWRIWLEELGGKPPYPKLTDDRKKKLGLLWKEQLRDQDNPLACFRSILRAIKASEFHMSKRAYQLPESTFRDANKRDTWAIEARTNGRAGGHLMTAAEVEAWAAE